MKSFLFFFFALYALCAADSCTTVKNNAYIFDPSIVRDCFNTHLLPQGVIDSAIAQLEIAQKVYPYVDIAKNPPAGPREGYFTKVDFDTEFNTLKTELAASGRVTAKVYRLLMHFITKFHDGHFTLRFSNTQYSDNFFVSVRGLFPFAWTPLGVDDGKMKVQLNPTTFTQKQFPNMNSFLVNKIQKGAYAVTIDGVDTFEFYKNFFAKVNSMKSDQGKLFISRLFSGTNSFPLSSYPIDDNGFDEHVVVFSDGDSLPFNLTFQNTAVKSTKDDLFPPEIDISPKGGNNQDVIEALKHFKRVPNAKSTKAQTTYVQCQASDYGNYILLTTFSTDTVEDISVFVNQVADCASKFDENTAPIAILLFMNGGGYDYLSMITKSLLMPSTDARLLKAIRKTDVNKDAARAYFGDTIMSTETCYPYTAKNYSNFWKVTQEDNLGGNVVHKRTQKFYDSFVSELEEVKQYGIVKNPRKPTDVVVVTDGYCFSACSYFFNGVLESGSAITVGVGTANIGDEKFVGSQCPSNVIMSVPSFFTNVQENAVKFGVTVGVTLSETFPIVKDISKTQTPRDYTLGRVDANIGEFFVPFPVDQIMMKVAQLHADYKENCNPDNHHLLLYVDNCTSNDVNANKTGYACGSYGRWNTSDCRIATCKKGYIVDFESNSCIRNVCEPAWSASSRNVSRFTLALFFVFALVSFLF